MKHRQYNAFVHQLENGKPLQSQLLGDLRAAMRTALERHRYPAVQLLLRPFPFPDELLLEEVTEWRQLWVADRQRGVVCGGAGADGLGVCGELRCGTSTVFKRLPFQAWMSSRFGIRCSQPRQATWAYLLITVSNVRRVAV